MVLAAAVARRGGPTRRTAWKGDKTRGEALAFARSNFFALFLADQHGEINATVTQGELQISQAGEESKAKQKSKEMSAALK